MSLRLNTLFVGVFLTGLCLFFFFVSQNQYSTILVISHNNAEKNGGPITIMDLRSGETQKPVIPSSIGCSGIASVPDQETTIRVHCVGSQLVDTLWDLDVSSGDVIKYASTSPLKEIEGAFQHARMLIDSRGRQFLNVGVLNRNESGYVTSSTSIIIIDGGAVHRIPITDATSQFLTLKMMLDESEDTLWVMSMDHKEVVVDRIDLKTYHVDFSFSRDSYSGFDMILSGDNILFSTYRTDDGVDITILDKFTGQGVKDIQLPVEEDLGYNALSLLALDTSLLVSSMNGIYVLNKDTYEIIEFIKNNPRGQFTYMVANGDFLFAIDSYSRVLRMPTDDLFKTEVLIEASGQGLTSLYLINR